MAMMGPGLQNIILALASRSGSCPAGWCAARRCAAREMRVCRGGPRAGRVAAAHHVPRDPAQHPLAADRGRRRPHGARDHPRGQPVVPRPRRAAADAVLGLDGRRTAAAFMLDAWWCQHLPGPRHPRAVLAINVASDRVCATPSTRGSEMTMTPRRARAAPVRASRCSRSRSGPAFAPAGGVVTAVDGVDLDVVRGRDASASSARSGSGKSVTRAGDHAAAPRRPAASSAAQIAVRRPRPARARRSASCAQVRGQRDRA